MKYCKLCDYHTESSFNYERHAKTVKHIKKLSELGLMCPVCQAVFTKRTNCYRHQRKMCYSGIMQKNDFLYYTMLEGDASHLESKNEKYEKYDISLDASINGNNVLVLSSENNRLKSELELKEKLSSMQTQILEAKLENSETKLALHKLEAQKDGLILGEGGYYRGQIINQFKEGDKTINFNGSSDLVITKKDRLNMYFGNTIDIDTFTENYKTKPEYQLTFEETRILLENAEQSGIASYGYGLFNYLQKKYQLQVEDLSGEKIDMEIMPFISADSNLRRHYEKTPLGWMSVNTDEKLKKLVIISNDQVYKHHKKFIKMSSRQKQTAANSLLKRSDYYLVEIKSKALEGIDPESRLCITNISN